MKILLATATYLVAYIPFIGAESIIGYDGKEIAYGAHRDGLHDRALHGHSEHRRHDLRHAKLEKLDTSDLPHMLNQAPMPSNIKHHGIRTNQTLHAKSYGASLAKNLGSNDIRDSATGLSRMKRKADSTDSDKENLSERIASRLNRIAHAHVRGTKRNFATAKRSAADKFAEAFVKETPGGLSPPAPAPSPGPMSAPGPAPAPMQVSGGWGTMDEDMGAPEQGFQGKVVEHDNMVTMTKDWRGEYGPNVKGYMEICALYLDNAWCRERGYHRSTPPPKSSALRPASTSFTIAALFLVFSNAF